MTPNEAVKKRKTMEEVPTFPPGYDGPKRYCVEHPDYREPIVVKAPNEAAALVAAANAWDDVFTQWRYHGRAIARRIK